MFFFCITGIIKTIQLCKGKTVTAVKPDNAIFSYFVNNLAREEKTRGKVVVIVIVVDGQMTDSQLHAGT